MVWVCTGWVNAGLMKCICMYVFIIYMYAYVKESLCMEYMELCSRGADTQCHGMCHVPSEESIFCCHV
jgi:hypothetical protein